MSGGLRFEAARMRREVDSLTVQISDVQQETDEIWAEIRARQAEAG